MRTIRDLFDDAIKLVDDNQITSLCLVMVDVNGKVLTSAAGEDTAGLALLAALDISKDHLKAELRS